MARTLVAVEKEIEATIGRSRPRIESAYADSQGRIWVLKFFPPQFLAQFMTRPELFISTSAGFTWGDGVYVVPIDHVYSGMIYGRVGAMGWLDAGDIKCIFDASDPAAIALYQEWLQFKPGLYRLLTTTVHSQLANRQLRNLFRRRFSIDLVSFHPDEFNRAYVAPSVDRWFVVSDFPTRGFRPLGSHGFSQRVRECEFVAISAEEFVTDARGLVRQDQVGPRISPVGAIRVPARRRNLKPDLMNTYNANRGRGTQPPTYLLIHP